MAKNILLRGLSSSGSDYLPFHWRKMMAPLARSLRDQGLDIHVLEGLGAGSIDQHVDKAVEILRNFHSIAEGEPLHLIGHSMGGVWARGLAQRPELNVVAVTTIASPHHGARMADLTMQIQTVKPKLHKMGKWFGFDFDERMESFADLRTTAMAEWNQNHQLPPEVDGGSFQFSVPVELMSPIVRTVFRQIPVAQRPPESDGYVELPSQIWAKSLGHFALDHLAAMGWNFHAWPPARAQFQREYQRFIAALTERLKLF